VRELSCQRCGNRVLVYKNSLAHTAVQWIEAERCEEFAASDTATELHATIPTCESLRASIRDAVRSGTVPVAQL
jgi:hypothetical protein